MLDGAKLYAQAAGHRRRFDIPVLAIWDTGHGPFASQLVAAVMGAHYACHFAQTDAAGLLALNGQVEVAVFAAKAEEPGDIETLSHILRPTHGLLPHLADEDGGEWAGEEMLSFLSRHHGCALVDLAAPVAPAWFKQWRMCVGYKRMSSLQPEPGIIELFIADGTPTIEAAFLSDDGPRVEVRSPLPATPAHIRAVMAAIAVGVYFKVPAGKIKAVLENIALNAAG